MGDDQLPGVRAEFQVTEDALRPRRRRVVDDRSGEVTHVRVHPAIWAHALRLAGGNSHRIKIISATRVQIME